MVQILLLLLQLVQSGLDGPQQVQQQRVSGSINKMWNLRTPCVCSNDSSPLFNSIESARYLQDTIEVSLLQQVHDPGSDVDRVHRDGEAGQSLELTRASRAAWSRLEQTTAPSAGRRCSTWSSGTA